MFTQVYKIVPEKKNINKKKNIGSLGQPQIMFSTWRNL